MSTVEPEAQATPTLPRRRGRWRRLGKGLLGTAIVLVLAGGVLRVTSLWGIPDAPEPFDAAAYLGETIPDDRNAAVLFARAYAMLDHPERQLAFPPLGMKAVEFADARPEALAWIEAHRDALETWRRGTERPDAMSLETRVPRWSPVMIDEHFHAWHRLALIEAGRLEAAGDLEGAWAWHRARLRANLLMTRRRGCFNRHHLSDTLRDASIRVGTWAKLPGMTVPLLRRALGDVEAMAGLHGTEADSLKTDYLALVAELDGFAANPSEFAGQAASASRIAKWGQKADLLMQVIPPDWLRPLYGRAATFVEAEPERSKRLARMLLANWLAQADRKPIDRAATVSSYPLVFDEDAGPTPSLPPSDLARRAATAPYLAVARGGFGWLPAWWVTIDQWPTLYRADRQTRADLILSLADRIYEIEKGKPPGTVEDLIGTVLPRLPEDYGASAAPAQEAPAEGP